MVKKKFSAVLDVIKTFIIFSVLQDVVSCTFLSSIQNAIFKSGRFFEWLQFRFSDTFIVCDKFIFSVYIYIYTECYNV
jgi:hypothetical protein